MKKEDFFSKLKDTCPDDTEIERTNEISNLLNIKNGEQLTRLYLKSDVIFSINVLKKNIKVSIIEFDINPLYCVSRPGYTYQAGLKHTDFKLQTLQAKGLFLIFEIIIHGAISSVIRDRYIKSDETKKMLCIDANILYGPSISQHLLIDEIKAHRDIKVKAILSYPDES